MKKLAILSLLILFVLLATTLVVGCSPPVNLTDFRTEAEPVIKEFMEAGVAKEVDRAYACWSSQAITKEQIVDMVENQYSLFAGFEALTYSGWSVTTSTESTTGIIQGSITYTDRPEMHFEARVIKQEEVFKLTSFWTGR